ncbi:MAG TPA: hypothetical protein VEV84_05610 [Pyrinomonadaceae bacterium]|nr:hypothetical protein [Pyrinomonadaceae bacterium]
MSSDPKRDLLRHMLATVAFRCSVAVDNAPFGFEDFLASESTRTPAEILAHLGDLIEGTHYLLQGKFVSLVSEPLRWDDEVIRFYTAVKELDVFLASDAPLAHPVEKFVQGPIGDALTHVGQIVMLRRIFGSPIKQEPYFTIEIVPGVF